MMDWKGFGRKLSWPNRGTASEFSWKYEENHKKPVEMFCPRLKPTPSIYESTALQAR
jgi:hypothetical protein